MLSITLFRAGGFWLRPDLSFLSFRRSSMDQNYIDLQAMPDYLRRDLGLGDDCADRKGEAAREGWTRLLTSELPRSL